MQRLRLGVKPRSMWFGRLLVGVAWADDGKWDWTSDVGDKHTDFASIAVCRRGDNPPLYRLTLGPFCVSAIMAPRDSDDAPIE